MKPLKTEVFNVVNRLVGPSLAPQGLSVIAHSSVFCAKEQIQKGNRLVQRLELSIPTQCPGFKSIIRPLTPAPELITSLSRTVFNNTHEQEDSSSRRPQVTRDNWSSSPVDYIKDSYKVFLNVGQVLFLTLKCDKEHQLTVRWTALSVLKEYW